MKKVQLLSISLLSFIFLGCGGGGATSPSTSTPTINDTPTVVGQPYSKKITSSNLNANFTLVNAPEGMSINTKTGLITWTPTKNQIGEFSFDVKSGEEITTITLNVQDATFNTPDNAIFISPDGDDNNDGSYDSPLKDTKKLCSKGSVIDKDIYFRGGSYDNFPMVQCSGIKDNKIEIKPWGNERVLFTFDGATGIRFNGNYIHLNGIEVEGVAQKIEYKDALANWWRGDKYYNGSGIVSTGHHVEIDNTVVHDAPGSGISARSGDYVNIHNNIVYNCDWWTIAGSKGIGVTEVDSFDNSTGTNIKIENNLIFNVESRIFSRVWRKGFAHLDLDEGEGILVQINNGDYKGRYSIKNNFLLYTGKGIVVNKTDRADVINNTLYLSGTTIAGKFKGVRASKTSDSDLSNNSVYIFDNGQSFNIGQSDSTEVTLSNNCGNGEESLDGVSIYSKIFKNPQTFDFTPLNGCKGASLTVFNELKSKADKLGIEIKPTNWKPDYTDITKGVINSIPEGAKVDWSSWNDNAPFELNIKNIPSGIKGRPSKFRLEVEYPYAR